MAGLILGTLYVKKGGNFLTRLQKIFAGREATHSFVVLSQQIYEEHYLLDAQAVMTIDPLARIKGNTNISYKIYEIPMLQETADYICKKLLTSYIGQGYGVLQLIWFVWRWFNEYFFSRDMRKKNNPFKQGIICSELFWYAIVEVGKKHNMKYWNYVHPYLADTIHSVDVYKTLEEMCANGDCKIWEVQE